MGKRPIVDIGAVLEQQFDHVVNVGMVKCFEYLETKRVDVVEQHFGQTIADPYRWLENDVRNDKEVAAWVES